MSQTLSTIARSIESLQAKSWLRDWGPLIAAGIAACIAIYSLKKNLDMATRGIREKAREEERAAIRERIEAFYGPFVLLRGKSRSLYEKLFLPRRSDAEKERYADAEGSYRTVVALNRAHAFTGVDKAVLNQIVEIGKQTAKLIQTRMGLIEDTRLRELLSYATAHFWVMQSLADGSLVGGGPEVEAFVFPRGLDAEIEKTLDSLNQRLAELVSS